MVITPENYMMIRWWEHGEKGVTDRQTDGRTDGRTDRRTDGRTDWTSHIAAWSQLKMLLMLHDNFIISKSIFVECCFPLASGFLWKNFLAATKQLYEWFSPSVRPSVCPSVCHTFLTMFPSSYHHEIFRSYYQWQKLRLCKRSRSEVKGQGHRGHNPTSPFPDCNSSLNSHMTMKWGI